MKEDNRKVKTYVIFHNEMRNKNYWLDLDQREVSKKLLASAA